MFLQVKNFTFYDVVLDFILMDAFDDLENPPSSVIAVVNNRWLSNGFKETVSIQEILDLSRVVRKPVRDFRPGPTQTWLYNHSTEDG